VGEERGEGDVRVVMDHKDEGHGTGDDMQLLQHHRLEVWRNITLIGEMGSGHFSQVELKSQ